MSLPDNVIAWAALRRVLSGSRFSPSMQMRFSFDAAITFALITGDAVIQLMAFRFDAGNSSLGTKVQATVRLLVLSVCLMGVIIAAARVNTMNPYHIKQVSRARLSNLAVAAKVKVEARREELTRASRFLEALEQDMLASVAADPVRVVFVRAETTIISLMFSSISVILYTDLEVILKELGYVS